MNHYKHTAKVNIFTFKIIIKLLMAAMANILVKTVLNTPGLLTSQTVQYPASCTALF